MLHNNSDRNADIINALNIAVEEIAKTDIKLKLFILDDYQFIYMEYENIPNSFEEYTSEKIIELNANELLTYKQQKYIIEKVFDKDVDNLHSMFV